MHDRANVNWTIPQGTVYYGQAQMAILMDIRAELRRVRSVLECPNTTDIPRILRAIRANTTKPRRKRASKRSRR